MVTLSATYTLPVTDEKRLFDLVEERRRKTGSSLSSDHGQHLTWFPLFLPCSKWMGGSRGSITSVPSAA